MSKGEIWLQCFLAAVQYHGRDALTVLPGWTVSIAEQTATRLYDIAQRKMEMMSDASDDC